MDVKKYRNGYEKDKLKNIIEERINKILKDGIDFLHKVRACERRNLHGN